MTVQLKCFVRSVHFIRAFELSFYINVWASIIQTFQLSEHTQVPVSSDEQGLLCLNTRFEYREIFKK